MFNSIGRTGTKIIIWIFFFIAFITGWVVIAFPLLLSVDKLKIIAPSIPGILGSLGIGGALGFGFEEIRKAIENSNKSGGKNEKDNKKHTDSSSPCYSGNTGGNGS